MGSRHNALYCRTTPPMMLFKFATGDEAQREGRGTRLSIVRVRPWIIHSGGIVYLKYTSSKDSIEQPL